jgi:small conductance mechanosensitive channel
LIIFWRCLLEESANYIAQVTEKALKQAWYERKPEYLRRQGIIAGVLILSAIALSAIIFLLQRQLKKREAILREQKLACDRQMRANTMAMEVDEEEITGYCPELAKEQLHNRQRLSSQGLQTYLLQVTQGAIWIGVLALVLGLFPFTRFWQGTVLKLPLLLGVVLLAIATAKWSGILVDRTLEKWLKNAQTLSPQETERWLLRANSFAPIIKGVIATILITTAILFVLSEIDEMKADNFWSTLIKEAEIRGVEDIDGYGFTIGLRFETKPGIFRKVVRECRRRLKPAFEKANIQFAERPIFQLTPSNN